MKAQLFQQAADLLWQAEENNAPCKPVRELFDDSLSIEDAYKIQEINTKRRLSMGNRIIGRKIGLTSEVVQKQLGVDQPDFGNIYANMVVMEGETIELKGLIQPKVEVELAVVLKKDLPHLDSTLLDVIAAIDYVLIAIEVVDSRINNWDIRIEDTIADNASSALIVLGQRPYQLSEIDMLNTKMSLLADGREVSQGVGRNCLGNPLIATRWLAQTMAKMGTPIKAGEVILTGALGPMSAVTEPTSYTAKFDSYGELTIDFI